MCPTPDGLLAGFYWYGAKRRSPGRTPAWLQRMLNAAVSDKEESLSPEGDCERDHVSLSGDEDNRPMSMEYLLVRLIRLKTWTPLYRSQQSAFREV